MWKVGKDLLSQIFDSEVTISSRRQSQEADWQKNWTFWRLHQSRMKDNLYLRHVLDEHKHFLLGCYAGPTQHYLKQSLHHHHEMEHSTVHYPGASPMETSLSIAQNGIVKRSMQPISEETMFQAMQQIHEKEKLLLQLQWEIYRREEQWMFASTTKDTCISLAPQLVHPPARTQDHAKETTILGDSQKSQDRKSVV